MAFGRPVNNSNIFAFENEKDAAAKLKTLRDGTVIQSFSNLVEHLSDSKT
jgi:hypothetical protein